MARRRSWWKLVLVLALIVLGGRGLLRCGGCASGTPPDARLARHFDRLCDVARDGVGAPERGVHRLMRYFGDHGPDMLEAFGQTLVVIERIDDDAAHDARARQARDRILAPLAACAETWQEFGEAIESDPRAAAALERGVERLARTLGILLGDDGLRAPLRGWPAGLRARLAEPR